MNEFDHEQFEAELKALRPKGASEQTLDGIMTEVRASRRIKIMRGPATSASAPASNFFRWLIPATALAVVATVIVVHHRGDHSEDSEVKHISSAARVPLKADKVEIDRQFVSNFDAVARLPTGEPVRFRCEQWTDKVRLRDSARGLMLERTTPRLEIVPVRYETY
jgi:hypothetical protein